VRLRYDFAYAWVDTDPYVVSNVGQASLIHAWSSRQNSALAGSYYLENYLYSPGDVPDGPGSAGAPCGAIPQPFSVCGPAGLDERRARERDGWGATGALTHAWSPAPDSLPFFEASLYGDPSVHGGYRYTHFESAGREYSHDSHQAELGVRFTLPAGISLQIDGSYTRRIYRNPSTFPNQSDLMAGREYFLSGTRRREDIYVGGARLWLPIYENLSAEASYRYRDSRSTADVFDYDQHIVGLLFNVTLARTR
jgi:hypothetical protein